jgi:hypothetical protein
MAARRPDDRAELLLRRFDGRSNSHVRLTDRRVPRLPRFFPASHVVGA